MKKAKVSVAVEKLNFETKKVMAESQWQSWVTAAESKREAEVAVAIELGCTEETEYIEKKTAVTNAIANLKSKVAEQCAQMAKYLETAQNATEGQQISDVTASAEKSIAEYRDNKVERMQVHEMLKDLKEWLADLKKVTAKKEKAEVKKNVDKRSIGSGKDKGKAPVVIGRLFREIGQSTDIVSHPINLKWNLKADFMDIDRACAVALSSDRFTPEAKRISSLPYFKSQKLWVKACMTQKGTHYEAAHIMKVQALKSLEMSFRSCFDEDIFKPQLDQEGPLGDAFRLQFFQHHEEAKICTTTPLLLSEIKVVVEGMLFVAGIDMDMVPGQGIAEKKRLSKTCLGMSSNISPSNLDSVCD